MEFLFAVAQQAADLRIGIQDLPGLQISDQDARGGMFDNGPEPGLRGTKRFVLLDVLGDIARNAQQRNDLVLFVAQRNGIGLQPHVAPFHADRLE